MKLTISCLLTLQMLHTKFGKDWPSSSWEEDVNARHTTDDDGRQPIAIGHLSYSADLKNSVDLTNFYYKLWTKYHIHKINKQSLITNVYHYVALFLIDNNDSFFAVINVSKLVRSEISC